MTARTRHPKDRAWALALAGLGLPLLASCATPPAPAPTPAPAPVIRPAPPPPPPPPPFQGDWRDAPQTPGEWRWSMANGHSTASYGLAGQAAIASLTCDRPSGRVILARLDSAPAPAATPMAIRTTFGLRPLISDPLVSTPGWLAVALSASDPLLDTIAFSRGRFAIEAAGLDTLYLPAWPEISRVIEDCR